MNNQKVLFLFVGESGAGKDTIANELESKFGYAVLKSYTTRKPRQYEGFTHIFISEDEIEKYKEDIVAYTFFDGNHYFSTLDQILKNDIYIIDPAGVRVLKEKTKDNKNIKLVTIYIRADVKDRKDRMKKRGDNHEKILDRIVNDIEMFKDIEYDYAVTNHNFDKAVKAVRAIMKLELSDNNSDSVNLKTCPKCGGTGTIYFKDAFSLIETLVKCPKCKGYGKIGG